MGNRLVERISVLNTLCRVLPSHQMDAIRVEEFCASVLMPLATPQSHPLDVTVAHLTERVPHGEGVARVRKSGRAVGIGYRWGPVWSTAWFRLRGHVPASFRGERVLLRFSSGTEACLWRDGEPVAGFDPYHDTAALWPSQWSGRARARGGERIDLAVEAACNLPLGATTFWWDQPEARARWAESRPGRLERAEVVTFDEDVWSFAQRVDWLRRMLWGGRPDDPRTNDIRAGLVAIIRAIPANGCTRDHVLSKSRLLDSLLQGRAGAEHPAVCVAIGHAHIDTAWLWRIDETRRKCVRSFATALASIDRFPHFRFLCSQAQQYAFVQQESPALFARIRDAVHAGRWEATGAMWIEPDGTCPSGESFVRQIVHGTRWWRDHVGGPACRQRMLYLPDTFGFPACLPQIMAKAGIDTFITNKMIWGDTNRFPHVTFRWRGLGTSQVLTHFTPGHNYNSEFLPSDLMAAAANIESQDQGRVRTYLQPYGWGDGGGGPDPAQIERTRIASRCEGMPSVTHRTAHDFCGQLHADADEAEAAGRPLPVWDGELYLEAHRGTYTTQRWIKRANRRAEELLRAVEMLAVLVPLQRRAERALLAELDALWKVVLLHQFHDILPGSSIGPVYDDARRELGGAISRLEALHAEGLARVAACAGDGQPLLLDPVRAAVMREADRVVNGAGSAAGTGARLRGGQQASASARRIQCGTVWAQFDARGRVRAIGDGTHEFAAPRGAALHELALYEDRPRRWEAWDTDREYIEKPIAMAARCAITSGVRAGAAWLRVERPLGAASRIVQVHEIRAGERMLRIRSRLEWREERTLLRALVHTGIVSRSARFGTQFGWIDRDAHENTSWQRAQFEVPGHLWMCMHDGSRGIAVLDDGIYGKSARYGTLGLSLAKSPNFPDPSADRGTHEFAYALMPLHAHERSPSAAAERFARPHSRVGRGIAGDRGVAVKSGSLVERGARGAAAAADILPGFARVDAAGHVEIAALKPADDGSGDVILRLVDHSGAPGRMMVGFEVPVSSVVRCDLHELPLRGPGRRVPMRSGVASIEAGPFEIVSLRISRGAAPRRQR